MNTQSKHVVMPNRSAQANSAVQMTAPDLPLIFSAEECTSAPPAMDPEAEYQLGLAYQKGDGVEKNDAEAVDWFQKAANQGHALAQHYLGMCYDKGIGVKEDIKPALKWYRKAAQQGHLDAQIALGVYYASHGLLTDTTLKWCRRAADAGHTKVQTALADYYEFVSDQPNKVRLAVKWWRMAAEQGSAYAQAMLGFFCSVGRDGIPKDEVESIKWYRKAAEQGDQSAQVCLGEAYLHGRGAPKDVTEALCWFYKAADQGNSLAQSNLGVCHSKGIGVNKDQIQAAMWFYKAGGRSRFNANSRTQKAIALIEQTILEAVKSGDIKTVTMLLQEFPEFIEWQDRDKKTLLHFAATQDVAALLIAKGAQVNETDIYDSTPLHEAILNGHVDVIKLLLANRAKVDAKNDQGYTPLYIATVQKHKYIVSLLQKHAGTFAED